MFLAMICVGSEGGERGRMEGDGDEDEMIMIMIMMTTQLYY